MRLYLVLLLAVIGLSACDTVPSATGVSLGEAPQSVCDLHHSYPRYTRAVVKRVVDGDTIIRRFPK